MKAFLETEIVRSYKRLAYTHWHALAEFVDNSTQAYLNNEAALQTAEKTENGKDFRLKVYIEYKRDQDILTIADNSIGMDESDLGRAMRIGKPPEDTSGRSRYGLGMKTAACWFGDYWTLKTKKLGSQEELNVTFDVNQVADGQTDLDLTRDLTLDAAAHFTVIRITKLHKKIAGKTVAKIKSYLRSFYRKDIIKYLDLYWDNERLSWDDAANIESELIQYEDQPLKKDFTFQLNGKTVTGWAGVFLKGGRPKAGFSILHNDRVIQGWPDAYRPVNIYGEQSNDLVNQRLVGEIDLKEFEISHTKDQILFGANEQDDLEDQLLTELGDMILIAKEFRKKDVVKSLDVNRYIRTLSKSFTEDFATPTAREIERQDESDQDVEVISRTNVSLCEHVIHTFSPTSVIKVNDLNVYLYVTGEINDSEQYVLFHSFEGEKGPTLGIVINISHPYYGIISNENELVTFFRQSVYDAFCIWDITKNETPLLKAKLERFSFLKDELLRAPIDLGTDDLNLFLRMQKEENGTLAT